MRKPTGTFVDAINRSMTMEVHGKVDGTVQVRFLLPGDIVSFWIKPDDVDQFIEAVKNAKEERGG